MNDVHSLTRRELLMAAGASVAGMVCARDLLGGETKGGFDQRGYYITFMRMPTFGLAVWKAALDCFAADGINLLILWMAGGFASKKFPITWKYNQEHENVRADFAGGLIDYAHEKGIKVLLGFTPFGYDGVNQYTLERPDLRARKKDGSPTDKFGIHCWGWNLCPSQADSQRFMLEYAQEMFFDFYPRADGVLIESSDYAICHCKDCDHHFYEREFDFVEKFSARIWKERPEAMIVVYPHYFSGSKVPGFDAQAARQKFNPRWTLFFTPHSAHIDRALISQARASIWSDDAPALRDPAVIRQGAIRAREAGVSGYVPSLEAFSYVASEAEEGRSDLIGQRQVPFGFGWLKDGQMPYDQLPIRVHRIAYREFSREPTLTLEDFKKRLGREVFGAEAETLWVEDLLLLERVFFDGRTWCQPSPLASPKRMRIDISAGRVKPGMLRTYRATLQQVQEMAVRHAKAENAGRRESYRIAKWVEEQWSGEMSLLKE
ncbi:MAG TPA: hypothetical protein VGP99_10195 [Tepidisphaeraceae bacterium]|nr:hypothetical protein [Tepidisphaeraceae bacterium]